MGCISSRSTISSQQNRHSNRRVPDVLAERHRQTLQLNVVCHQSYNSDSGLSQVNSRDRPRNYPNITQRSSYPKPPTKPCFGEYRCICGRTWSSRLSWKGNYQVCKRCKRSVLPHTQRELRPSDISSDKENVEQHPKELCQKCQQLGFYCGKRKIINPRHQLSNRI